MSDRTLCPDELQEQRNRQPQYELPDAFRLGAVTGEAMRAAHEDVKLPACPLCGDTGWAVIRAGNVTVAQGRCVCVGGTVRVHRPDRAAS